MNIIPSKRSFNVRTGVMSCFILPQNGVVEEQMHYSSSAGSSPQIAVGSTKDPHHNGNLGGSNDNPKRPKNLAVHPKNGYVTKNLREALDDDEVDNGSLPCSPGSDSDAIGSAAGVEVLDHDTRLLISCTLRDHCGLSKSRWNESKALVTMKRVVDGVLDKHRYAYNGMINKLSLEDRNDDASFVSAVATSLFADGTTNWGRVASLVAFGAAVCQHLKEKGRENCVELVAQEISTYLLCEQRDWLVKNNAWDGFVEFFRVTDPESMVRNTLMAFAGFAGIGATLALLIR